jgi:hypothetical protein
LNEELRNSLLEKFNLKHKEAENKEQTKIEETLKEILDLKASLQSSLSEKDSFKELLHKE